MINEKNMINIVFNDKLTIHSFIFIIVSYGCEKNHQYIWVVLMTIALLILGGQGIS